MPAHRKTGIPNGDSRPGIAIDSHGGAVVDPSQNVLDLVEAAIQRQDDLREMEHRWLAEVALIRSSAAEKDDGLRAQHNAELIMLRSEYDGLLRKAESDRINAIRAVDVLNVAQAASAAETRATALATSQAQSAETLRNQVASTASAADTNLRSALDPIQKDIADLRRAQYEAQGQKTQVVEAHATGANTGMWVGIAVTVVLGLLSLIIAAVSISVVVFHR